MTSRHHLAIAVEDDRSAVRLTISRDEQPVFGARLEAPELDDLIRALSQGRRRLADAVAPELDDHARIADAVPDPAFLLGSNPRKREALLALRHPGFGWLGFQFRRSTVERVVQRLAQWLHDVPGD